MATPFFRRHVFISYSHKDREWLDRLKVHLAPYLQGEQMFLWDDSKIVPGTAWAKEIEQAMSEARVAILLVSPNFLASKYVLSVELPAILSRAGRDLVLLWVPIAPSAYEATPLNSIQAASDPKRPLSLLSRPKQDEALVAITRHVSATMNVNAIGNTLKLIDAFTPEVTAFMAGAPEPSQPPSFSIHAEQVSDSVNLVEHGQSTRLIDANGLERLGANDQQLIRSFEKTMQELFDRWTELKPKRVAVDPGVRAKAVAESDAVRRDLCNELTDVLGFIESLGMSLRDHYSHVRFICRPSVN